MDGSCLNNDFDYLILTIVSMILHFLSIKYLKMFVSLLIPIDSQYLILPSTSLSCFLRSSNCVAAIVSVLKGRIAPPLIVFNLVNSKDGCFLDTIVHL